MASKEILFKLYQKLYEQRAVLTAAPKLTIEINEYTASNYPEPLAAKECAAVTSYLCSVPSIDDIAVESVLKIVKKNYEDQPFWKNVILDYLEYKYRQQQEECYERNIELLKKTAKALNELRQEENRRKRIITTFGDKIKNAGFRVDGYNLFKCYLVMFNKDREKAYETLITNPAYFSPIIAVDSAGNQILTPAEAIEENKKLAKFLKTLKI